MEQVVLCSSICLTQRDRGVANKAQPNLIKAPMVALLEEVWTLHVQGKVYRMNTEGGQVALPQLRIFVICVG